MTITHFFSRFPAPESRKPLANGLLSIFSWVICARNYIKCCSVNYKCLRSSYVAPACSFAYLLVLICGDGNEFRFLEHVRAKRGVGQLKDVVGSDQMKPRLILVHGVEYRL